MTIYLNGNNIKDTAGARYFPVSSILIGLIALLAPWATYTQFYFLSTPSTIASFFIVIYSIFYFGFNKKISKFYLEDAILLFFILSLCVGYFISLNRESWALVAFWYSVCFSTYVAAKSLLVNKYQLKIISYFGVAGILITFFLLEPAVDEYGILYERQAVPNHNNNFTAYCISAITFLIASNIAANKNKLFEKIILHFSIGLSAYCIVLLGTRGALASVSLLYATLLCKNFLNFTIYRISAFLSVAISAATALGLFEAILVSIDTLSLRGDGELSGRSPSWQVARTYFLDYPFLGIGPGAFQFVNPLQIGVHNTVLGLVMDTGLLGVTILSTWLAINFSHIKLKEPLKSQIAVLWMAYALPISLSGEWLQSPIVWVTFAVLFGLRETAGPSRKPS